MVMMMKTMMMMTPGVYCGVHTHQPQGQKARLGRVETKEKGAWKMSSTFRQRQVSVDTWVFGYKVLEGVEMEMKI